MEKDGDIMNNYCRNCGEKLEENVEECSKCGAKVFTNRVNIAEEEIEIQNKASLEKKYIIALVCLYIAPYIFGLPFFARYTQSLANVLSPILVVAFLVLLVYARIKLKWSKVIRIIFAIAIGLFLLRLIVFLLLFVTCMGMFGW